VKLFVFKEELGIASPKNEVRTGLSVSRPNANQRKKATTKRKRCRWHFSSNLSSAAYLFSFQQINIMNIISLVVLLLSFSIGNVQAFSISASPARRLGRSSALGMVGEAKYTLVLVRHGESTWNKENRFTGWVDCPLSEEGENEAVAGGKLLLEAGYTFDKAYTSTLKRAIKTLWLVLEELDLMYIPIQHTWRLNERHYGALQGLNKQETVDKHGKDQVLIWRRSYDIPPPPVDFDSVHFPGNDAKYANVDKNELPRAESLKLTEDRFMTEWTNVLVPEILSGQKLLIAAHGNTLRALVKHLDNISSDAIVDLNIPTGVPLVYELDANLQPVRHPDAIAPLQGHYLGNQVDVQKRIGAVLAQTK
jgi:2,3-bisphosphoglycerate-dependent phosphoglycerate mutase